MPGVDSVYHLTLVITTNNFFKNTLINATGTDNGIKVQGSWTISNVPLSDIAHTFTLGGFNLNVLAVVSSIVQFSFQIGTRGPTPGSAVQHAVPGPLDWDRR